ncbi:MAG: DUF4870 domain-containing protein [Planctomycetes bacterium]|nr:DUF4870 domain-containing protein [Planctomycetota bacterium]
MLCHLTALAMLLGIPFGHILGPMVVWLLKKEEHAFVNDQGMEALNFQITMTIAGLVGVATACLGIGFVILGAVIVVNVVFIIIGAIKANEGAYYRYPFNIRLIK